MLTLFYVPELLLEALCSPEDMTVHQLAIHTLGQ